MKRTLIAFIALAVSIIAVNAQYAVESTAKLDKKRSGTCVSIKVKANTNDAQKVLETLFKNEKLKGKSGKISTYENVVFPTISTDYINMFVSYDVASKDKNNPETTVNVFVSKGISTDFVNSRTDLLLISNLRAYLDQKYFPAIVDNQLTTKKEAKNKEIKEAKASLDKMKKELEQKTKNVSSNESDIKKLEDKIGKSKNDIEASKRDLEKQKSILQDHAAAPDVVDKTDDINKSAKALDKLQKDIEKKTKDISGSEKDIEKAKSNIDKNKKEIEATKKSIDAQNKKVEKLQQELNEIK